ncbi:hypothetical protein GcM1_189030 [Golovinomyces cichoracearum]|uniref:Uncharacterized protein n=1 Tax=Golovinomyces cichoracearum TaxID=62708 RepID=A0A420J217_9PEZI|nr:hypothetical protein GcM1_189030 [Golovinomyces cichoracearum]
MSKGYLISKFGDPIFAIFVGLTAAVIKIDRKEKELGHCSQETIEAACKTRQIMELH